MISPMRPMERSGYEADTGRLDWMSAENILGSVYQHYDLDWDEVGNLNWRANLTGGSPWGTGSQIVAETENYQYDGLNRLALYSVDGNDTAVFYDNIGNITQKSDLAGGYSYGTKASSCSSSDHVTPGPHAVSSAGGDDYCYDANGNMVLDETGRTLTYSVFDKVTQMTKGNYTTTFDYGSNRSRYRRTDNDGNGTTETLYLGSVEKITNDDGTIEWKRDIGVGQITQVVDSTGAIQSEDEQYFLKDHLGSITHIIEVNGNGSVGSIQEMAFDPWGKRRDTTDWAQALSEGTIQASFYLTGGALGSPTTTKGFTGHEMVDEMDIIHMNGRIYDATIARFVQADPIIQAPYRTASLNRYSYVWNNPMNATDPSGYETQSSGYTEEVKVTARRPTAPDWGDFAGSISWMFDYEANVDWDTGLSGYNYAPEPTPRTVVAVVDPATGKPRLIVDDETGEPLSTEEFLEAIRNAYLDGTIHEMAEESEYVSPLLQDLILESLLRSALSSHGLLGSGGSVTPDNINTHYLTGRTNLKIEFQDEYDANGKLTVRNMKISGLYSDSTRRGDQIVAQIEEFWQGKFKDDSGVIWNLTTKLTNIESLSIMQRAMIGDEPNLIIRNGEGECGLYYACARPTEIIIDDFFSAFDQDALAHEFGHALGFYHWPAGSGNIMSYDLDAEVQIENLILLWRNYGPQE